MLFVHNSREVYNSNLFIPIANNPETAVIIHKPSGGIWLSDYTPDNEYVSYWLSWVSHTSLNMHEHNYLYEVDMSRVYRIDSYDDLLSLFSLFSMDPPLGAELFGPALNWEAVAKEYTGVYLSPMGFLECSRPWLTRKNYTFHMPRLDSWDVPSLLVMDPSVMTYVKEL
jgi:hypothetical protein